MKRLRPLLLFAVIVSFIAFSPVPSAAQEGDEAFRVGTHVFRLFMHHEGLKPLTGWHELMNNPEENILVLLGEMPQLPRQFTDFVEQGGAVLLATDRALWSGEVSRLCGYFPIGGRVYSAPPNDPDQSRVHKDYRYQRGGVNFPPCLVVQPTAEGGPDLFRDVRPGKQKAVLRVVTNRSGLLARDVARPNVNQPVLAELPVGCWVEPQGKFLQPGGDRCFAVSATVGKGRFLLLADHSVFINEMVLQEDNNNLDFAYRSIQWLKDNKRKHVLFVEDQSIQTQLKVPLRGREVTIQELEADLIHVANGIAKDFQDENARTNRLNNGMQSFFNEGPGRAMFGRNSGDNVYLFLILCAGVAVAALGLFALMRASHRNESSVPLFETVSGRQRAAVSPLVLKQRAALHTNDLREFGREAAREWFASQPGHPPDESAEHMPRIEMTRGGWWHQRQVRNEVMGLWHLAYADAVPHLNQQDYRRLLSRIDRLQSAIDTGELRLVW